MIRALEISSSALVAQRIRIDVIAGNIANANVTRQDDGTIQPYRRRRVFFATGRPDGGGPGVHVAQIDEDPSEFRKVKDASHADRIREGKWKDYVQFPNVNITMEYVDAITAARAYEANVSMMEVTKGMIQQAIRLFA